IHPNTWLLTLFLLRPSNNSCNIRGPEERLIKYVESPLHPSSQRIIMGKEPPVITYDGHHVFLHPGQSIH
ncbi:hypothetical protein STEG23_020237, partial [Scotinomys teguina]